MELLEGKVSQKHKLVGGAIIIIAIILIILAVCTNFFGSDTDLFFANKVVSSGDESGEEYGYREYFEKRREEEEKEYVPNFSGVQDTSIGYESGYIPAPASSSSVISLVIEPSCGSFANIKTLTESGSVYILILNCIALTCSSFDSTSKTYS